MTRCLIKLLEGLVVNYDNTVRDSDNSVIQFQVPVPLVLSSTQLPGAKKIHVLRSALCVISEGDLPGIGFIGVRGEDGNLLRSASKSLPPTMKVFLVLYRYRYR